MSSKDSLFRLENLDVNSSDSEYIPSPPLSVGRTGMSEVVGAGVTPSPQPKFPIKRRKYVFGRRKRKAPWLKKNHHSSKSIGPRSKRTKSTEFHSPEDISISIPSPPLSTSSPPSMSHMSSPPNTTGGPRKSTSASKKISLDTPRKRTPATSACTVVGKNGVEQTITVSELTGNIVFDSEVLRDFLYQCTVCRTCKVGRIKMWNSGTRACFGQVIQVTCDHCEFCKRIWTLSGKFHQKIPVGDTTISKRNDSVYGSILAGRLVGLGRTNLNLYHALLGIPSPPSGGTFQSAQRDLLTAAEEIAKRSMIAGKDTLVKNLGTDGDGFVHEVGSYDGSYQKRPSKSGGGSSRYCFASVISSTTGCVLAYDVACNSCQQCTFLDHLVESCKITQEDYDSRFSTHLSVCPAKYRDFSSVSLESQLAPGILSKALDLGVIFDGIVSDGDNKTIEILREKSPYQSIGDPHIARYECMAHVCKRMKTHLIEGQKEVVRKAKGESKKGVKRDLSKELRTVPEKEEWTETDETPTATKKSKESESEAREINHLSDELCSRITSLYQLAVRQNLGNPSSILRSIRAIPLHLGANGVTAAEMHRLCPESTGSWCKYRRAIATENPPPSHSNFLSPAAVSLVQNIFHRYRYDSESFVEQIADARTSNHNEALHSVLFSMVRKTSACSLDVMRLGAALAVARYNSGMKSILSILDILDVKTHPALSDLCDQMDRQRVERSFHLETKQKQRFIDRMMRQKHSARKERKHGRTYNPGVFSASNIDPVDSPLAELSDNQEEFCKMCGRTEKDELSNLDLDNLDLDNLELNNLDLNNLDLDNLELNNLDLNNLDLNNLDLNNLELNNLELSNLELNNLELSNLELNNLVDSSHVSWVYCDRCGSCFHFHCVGLQENQVVEDEWFCDSCTNIS